MLRPPGNCRCGQDRARQSLQRLGFGVSPRPSPRNTTHHFTPPRCSELHLSALSTARTIEDHEAENVLPRLTSRVRIPSPLGQTPGSTESGVLHSEIARAYGQRTSLFWRLMSCASESGNGSHPCVVRKQVEGRHRLVVARQAVAAEVAFTISRFHALYLNPKSTHLARRYLGRALSCRTRPIASIFSWTVTRRLRTMPASHRLLLDELAPTSRRK